MQFPLLKLYKNSAWNHQLENSGFTSYFDPGICYGLSNIESDFQYIGAAQGDPLPRNLILGINFKTGLTYKGLNLISFNYAHEIEDLLVDRRYNEVTNDPEWDYPSGLHNINIWDDLILGKSNKKNISKKGYAFNFAGIYTKLAGKYEDPEGRVFYKTKGAIINYMQILNTLMALSDFKENIFVKFLSCISFEKHTSKNLTDNGHPLNNIEFESYIIRFKNSPLN